MLLLLLLSKQGDVHFIWAGNADEFDGARITKLEKEADALGLRLIRTVPDNNGKAGLDELGTYLKGMQQEASEDTV